MALNKQPFSINFSGGLETKQDPFQIPAGKFLSLQNSIFDVGGMLQKRNGYAALASLPNTSSTYLTTLNGNLTAVGTSISALASGSGTWVSRGTIQPMEVKTLPVIRNNLNQTQCDSVVAANGLVCTVYSELNNATTTYKYVVSDSNTGQNIVAPTVIPVASGTVTGSPRVFLLGNYFILVFTNVISATSHLQYIAVSTVNPTVATANADIASAYTSATTLSWDGVVAGNNLYVAYNTVSGGQSVKVTQLTVTLTLTTAITFSGYTATMMSVTADTTSTSPSVYVSFYNSATSTGYTLSVNSNLSTILSPVQIITSGTILNMTSAAQNGLCTIFYEISNNYSYDSSIPSHYINSITVTGSSGALSPVSTIIRSVGLASKAFIVNGTEYFLAAYQSPYQPTYFLVNGSTSLATAPVIVGKLAYENGGGYLTIGLPNATVVNSNVVYIPYLYKDLIESLNTVGNSTQTTTGGIYSQTGINLGSFTIGTQGIDSAEIASALHISGGFLWEYDGYLPVEHNFFLWPDSIECSWSNSGGSIHAQPDGSTNTNAYYYQVTYEWTDNQGNIHRSSPSIPVAVSTSGTGTSGSITVSIPTLRLTYKTANPVKIVIYRWSVANQSYYQVTSITAPQLNSTTSDSISFVDTLADANIIGNNLIYTTGGVVEDVNAPATNIMTLFDDRLWMVSAEDQNTLWFSKQVIEATPVEMSDLFTFYVAPTTAAQGSTGSITALAPMDDKLIIFKANAIYYINGSGPDNTGSNNQYSQPIFITSTVGCSNQQSIVFTNQGLMFQSSKGIWLLGRDLSTNYVGSPVDKYNSAIVQSAVNVPETNQVRFTLNTGITLMYDYFYGQWGTFVGVPAVSSCIFQGLHTFINSYGAAYQENPGSYVDGSNPVLISFQTGWFNLAGLQGYQRIYDFYMLGTYVSPHYLNLQVAYDYSSAPSQQSLISPSNYTGGFGADQLYGQTSPYGGPGSLEQWRVHTQRQTCQSFQITLQEIFNPFFGTTPGAGFTLSGITARIGLKKGTRPVKAANSVG